MTDFVLVHGGMHTASCWDPVVPLLDGRVVAVDLPGRGRRPADVSTVTLDECVRAVLDDMDAHGIERACLVGHSMGGITLTELGHRHPDRVSHLIYVGAIVPGPGETNASIFVGEPLPAMPLLPEAHAKELFGNDLTDEQWTAHYATLVDEAPGIFNADVSGYASGMPIAYVNMTDDVPVPPDLADRMASNLGPGVVRHTIDTGHTVMVSQPQALASFINDFVK